MDPGSRAEVEEHEHLAEQLEAFAGSETSLISAGPGGMAEEVAFYRKPKSSETSTALPAEFAQLAAFYDVTDMAALVRVQEGRIEHMRQQLPKPRGPESDPHNYRRG